MEVMGRNTGWLAAATALAAQGDPDRAPHIVLVPEAGFDEAAFLARVREITERLGYCAVTVAEGIRRPDGSLLMEKSRDARGYVQLGGAGLAVARLINERLGYKFHWAIPDYLQRSAGHWLSATDRAQAEAVGRVAVEYALAGKGGTMPAIRRLQDAPYRWDVALVDAAAVANLERGLPDGFVRADGLHVTAAACDYISPADRGRDRAAGGGRPAGLRALGLGHGGAPAARVAGLRGRGPRRARSGLRPSRSRHCAGTPPPPPPPPPPRIK